MPRKNKTNRIGPLEEAENAKALDAAAGVAKPGPLTAALPAVVERLQKVLPPVDNAAQSGSLTYNTREKLLLKCASEGLTDEFFEKFTDRKELLDLTCMLGIRRLAMIICCRDTEIADVKDAIAVMRVVLNMVYGENASMSPEKFIAPPPTAQIPAGATEGVDAAMEKMKKLAGSGR
jgi:hypothetical protein